MPKTESRKTAPRKIASKRANAAPEPDGPAHPEAVPAKPAPERNDRASAKASGRKKPVPRIAESLVGLPPKTSTKGKAKLAASSKKGRLPPRKTFLVAATRTAKDGTAALQVYAAVTRSPAEALAAARTELGPEVAVELTGKLSNRMAKALGLKPGALHPI